MHIRRTNRRGNNALADSADYLGEKGIVEESTGGWKVCRYVEGRPSFVPEARQRPEAFDGESDESRLCEIEGPVSLGIAIYGDSRVISLVWRPTRPNDYYDLRIRPRLITYVLLEIVYYVHFKKLTLFNLYILLLLLYTYYWYIYHIENFWKK